MKDLNAIYHFNNGDYLINQLNFLLKNKIKNLILKILNPYTPIKIKNAHADVFEILIYADLNIDKILEIKNIIYEQIVWLN